MPLSQSSFGFYLCAKTHTLPPFKMNGCAPKHTPGQQFVPQKTPHSPVLTILSVKAAGRHSYIFRPAVSHEEADNIQP